ncbi:hypothetical protein SEA_CHISANAKITSUNE_60 [Gordonia phage ChisanaKitsune]|uniref:Uncharacterized protein n=1 Tax=Gordonia phage ChisanaKitsune TaxID=2871538 RepID=A0AAE7XGB9_9CAUD|nr:hypothetical protein PQD15_gp060 [Gordonia phage ChisanaKitsune]QZE10829.1 hypothetical protein SEA_CHISANAKITSUNE_60 [Gordonia phage ChisanaKitsune]
MDLAQLVSAIFTGMSVLISAVGGVLVLRNRKQQEDEKRDQEDLKYFRRENQALKSYNLAATRHMYRLEIAMASHGIEPPVRPSEITGDPDLPDRPIRDPNTGGFGIPKPPPA